MQSNNVQYQSCYVAGHVKGEVMMAFDIKKTDGCRTTPMGEDLQSRLPYLVIMRHATKINMDGHSVIFPTRPRQLSRKRFPSTAHAVSTGTGVAPRGARHTPHAKTNEHEGRTTFEPSQQKLFPGLSGVRRVGWELMLSPKRVTPIPFPPPALARAGGQTGDERTASC